MIDDGQFHLMLTQLSIKIIKILIGYSINTLDIAPKINVKWHSMLPWDTIELPQKVLLDNLRLPKEQTKFASRQVPIPKPHGLIHITN